MEGFDKFLNLYPQTGRFEKFTAISLVKDMMVQTTVFDVAHRSLLEISFGAAVWVESLIMKRKDLFQVSQVSFVCSPVVIFDHVVYRRWLTPMIKRPPIVWKNNDQRSMRFDDSFPFTERLYGIRNVLEIV